MLLAKKNVGKRVKGLAFRVVDKKTGDAVVDEFGAVEWEGETDVTADQALGQRKPDGRSSAKPERAKEIIEEMIAAGLVHSQLIFDRCEKENIGKKSVWKARRKLRSEGRVEYQRVGRDRFEWRVPVAIEQDEAGNEIM